MKAKQDCSLWSSEKRRKLFSKINDSVKYSLQKWITYHQYVIKYPISNDYITAKFYNGIMGVKPELRHKFLLQASVRELHK